MGTANMYGNDPLITTTRDDPLGQRPAARTRGENISRYFQLMKDIAWAGARETARPLVPPELWADLDFQEAVLETIVRNGRAQADLAVITRVFGGKAER